MKKLENLNLKELTTEEQVNVNGGWLKTAVGIAASMALYYYDNWDKVKEGYNKHN